MISGVSSGVQMSMPRNDSRTEQALTAENQQLISDTLSQFDPDNLTEADALSIIETLSEAGIQPGQGLESALSELGFDAKSIGELAGVSESEGSRPPPPPPPQQSTEEISDLVDFVTTLLEEKLAESADDSLSDEDKESIYAQINEKFGFDSDDSIIDLKA
ncbi:hypothetical protein ACPUVO_17395 [Pseudocolwellia sp. HL-MZ19]|uniref:hypothetical protein n=1 Tax=Pseudocolwellia sp. HL-MZ19 TaxID=3400846 RepID=UPI003CF77432